MPEKTQEKEKIKEARAVARFIHTAPRKLRLIIDAIRGKSVAQARAILKYTGKRAARILEKLLNSAVANAENNFRMNGENLYIYRAFVDQGPIMYRWMPRARGMATRIRKKTSHITIVVREREE